MGLLQKLGFRSRHRATRPGAGGVPVPGVSGLAVPLVEVLPVTVGRSESPAGTGSVVEPAERRELAVAELARKLDSHLDRARDVEQLLESLPERLNGPAAGRHQEQVELLRILIAEHRASGDCLDTALTRLAEQSESAVEARRELATAMETFRGTLLEVVRSTERSASALETRAAQEREWSERMTGMVGSVRKWGGLLVGVALVVSLASLILAVFALMDAGH